jgi:RNA polymerase sigma factor (TIGR02999 family)
MADEPQLITALLKEWQTGDKQAANRLMELVYDDLHQIASREMRRENGEHTLRTTALVHEAYLRLCGSAAVQFKDRAHFFAVAALQLRRVLVDHARRHRTEKRGGGLVRLDILDDDGATVSMDERLLAVHEALTRLEALDARAAKVVELRFFGGLNESEAAETLGISIATVKRDLDFAKSWLVSQLK